MAAAYRRRSDGTLEIIRPRTPSKLKGTLTSFAATLSIALLPLLALLIFVSIGGMPPVLGVVIALAGYVWWHGLRLAHAPEEPQGATIRIAHVQGSRTP